MSLEGVAARLARAALVLDFDGTLAPIVLRAEEARPVAGAASVLSSLVGRVHRLAVVTGRPAAFVQTHLPVPGLEVVGLYGLEGEPPVTDAVREAVAMVADAEPGAVVEDKGAAIAVHVRATAEPDAAARRLRVPMARIAGDAQLVLLEGKMVLELAPLGGGKGEVVRRLCADAGAALFAGDDLADLAAFDVLDELETSGLEVARVAVGDAEAPVELVDRADLTVEGPWGLLDLLRRL